MIFPTPVCYLRSPLVRQLQISIHRRRFSKLKPCKMPFQPKSHPGVLHHYTSRLTAFEHVPTSLSGPSTVSDSNPQSNSKLTNSQSQPHDNYIIFLGGLGDGLCTVNYPHVLASMLERSDHLTRWRVVEVLLSSSYSGWKTSNLAKDAAELSKCMGYFRSLQSRAMSKTSETRAQDAGSSKPKIILVGHSTGCQIAMEYLVGPSTRELASSDQRPDVDGLVLQAGISDREGMLSSLTKEQYAASCAQAANWVRCGKSDDVLGSTELPDPAGSLFGGRPTASRWLSLAGPDGPGTGGDDYFSSDVPDESLKETFGRLKIPVCILLSGQDEHMPESVSKDDLFDRWRRRVKVEGGRWSDTSAIVAGASHNLNRSKEAIVADLTGRISKFAAEVQKLEPEVDAAKERL